MNRRGMTSWIVLAAAVTGIAWVWCWLRYDEAAARARNMARNTAEVVSMARQLDRMGAGSGGVMAQERIGRLPKIVADAAEEAGVLQKTTHQAIEDRPAGRSGSQVEAGRQVAIRDATLDQIARFAAAVIKADESLRITEMNLEAAAPLASNALNPVDAPRRAAELWSADLAITYLRARSSSR